MFGRAGVQLPLHIAPSLGAQIGSYVANVAVSRPVLIKSGHEDIIPRNILHSQLPLPLIQPTRPVVVRFAPRSSHVYLDYGVFDMFRDVPGLSGAAMKLEANDIYVLGQLVQLPEERLRAYPFITDRIVSVLRAQLAPLGLDLGMRIPSWYREFKHLLKVCP